MDIISWKHFTWTIRICTIKKLTLWGCQTEKNGVPKYHWNHTESMSATGPTQMINPNPKIMSHVKIPRMIQFFHLWIQNWNLKLNKVIFHLTARKEKWKSPCGKAGQSRFENIIRFALFGQDFFRNLIDNLFFVNPVIFGFAHQWIINVGIKCGSWITIVPNFFLFTCKDINNCISISYNTILSNEKQNIKIHYSFCAKNSHFWA